jgi:cytochrome P450
MSTATAKLGAGGRSAIREPPGPPGHWLLGHSREFEQDALGVFMRGFREFGDVVAFRFGPIRACLLAHPDHVQHVLQKNHRNYDKNAFSYRRLRVLIGDGLITSDGARWQAHRSLAQPAFQRRQLESVASASLRAAHRVADAWRTRAGEGGRTDLHRDMMSAALEVAAAVLFGAEIAAEADAVGQALDLALAETVRRVYALLPLPMLVPTPANLRLRRAITGLHVLVERLVERRRRSGQGRGAPLRGDLRGRPWEPGALLDDLLQGLDGRALRDEVVTFLLAGHETTANLLTWAIWLLGLHPEIAARLRAEIETALGGRPPTLDDLPRLGYVRMVLEEAMRLYPPVWVVDRNTVAEDTIGRHRIAKGTLVMLSQYVTHRHPAFWPDPERFDPDRFGPAAARARPRYAYFPFIGGPRMCMGAQFAMTEATLILACLARRFALTPIAGEAVEVNPSVTLRPRHGAPMHVTEIESVRS